MYHISSKRSTFVFWVWKGHTHNVSWDGVPLREPPDEDKEGIADASIYQRRNESHWLRQRTGPRLTWQGRGRELRLTTTFESLFIASRVRNGERCDPCSRYSSRLPTRFSPLKTESRDVFWGNISHRARFWSCSQGLKFYPQGDWFLGAPCYSCHS